MYGYGEDLIREPFDQLTSTVIVIPQPHTLVSGARGDEWLAHADVHA